jgi:phosphatidylglycerophosphatase A
VRDDAASDYWLRRLTAAAPTLRYPVRMSATPDRAPASALALGGPRRADVRFLLAHPAHFIALGFGCGLARIAPGTVGTLWAWIAFALAHPLLGDAAIGVVLLAGVGVATWSATVTARHLRNADPGAVVVDEIVAFSLVLWLVLPASWWAQAVAFALFRFFDTVKPGPVAWADAVFALEPDAPAPRRFGWVQGFGIVFDDLVAAFCTLLVVALWRAL